MDTEWFSFTWQVCSLWLVFEKEAYKSQHMTFFKKYLLNEWMRNGKMQHLSRGVILTVLGKSFLQPNHLRLFSGLVFNYWFFMSSLSIVSFWLFMVLEWDFSHGPVAPNRKPASHPSHYLIMKPLLAWSGPSGCSEQTMWRGQVLKDPLGPW